MKNICRKFIGIVTIIILILSFNISLAVSQSDINKQKNQQEENNNKITEAEEAKEKIEAEKSDVQKQVESLASQINQYQSQIDSLDSQINDANAKIKEQETKLTQAEKDYSSQKEKLQDRMVAVYESGDVKYLDVLLSSESITDFISKYYLVSEITECDTELLEKIQKQKEEIETAKKELENGKNELTTAKSNKESVSTQLKSTKSEKDSKVAQLSEDEKAVEAQIEELQSANRQLANQIKDAEKKYAAQLAALQAAQNGNSNSQGAGSGFFMRPTSGSISATAYYSSGKFHGALDYAVSPGTPVYAAATGVVMSIANLSGSYGTYVVIRHANGLQSYYAHGTYGSICVSAGQTVSKGQKIMLSGNTGNSSGPHLHFEVRTSPYSYNGYATAYGQDSRVNPANYM